MTYTPYEDGFDAGFNGHDASANPHKPGTKKRLIWNRGWCDGADEIEKRNLESDRSSGRN